MLILVPQKLKFCGYAIGIFGCFGVFGILQEKIFRGRFGDEISSDGEKGERYTMSITFNAIQCTFFVLFAKVLTFTHKHPKNETSQGFYLLSGLFNVVGSVTAYMSLQWVPFVTQIVGKSCRPIPVMILGFLLAGKRYKWKKVIFVLTIVMGVSLFIFKDKATDTVGGNALLGNILIGTSLLMDGLCGVSEDRMRSVAMPTTLNFMMYSNLWAVMFLLVGMVSFSEGPKFVEFVTKYPEIWQHFGLAVLVGSLGQIFVSAMVLDFGPLALSITTTTRKIFSVCLSVIIYGNELNYWQWGAAALIFIAIIVDALLSKSEPNVVAEDEDVTDVSQTEGVTDVSQTVSVPETPGMINEDVKKKNVIIGIYDQQID